MPVSSDIYGQIQQPRQRNVLADFANIQQIQQGQAQNELMRLKMDEYQRGIGDQNRLRGILQGTEESQLADALRRGGFLQQSQDYTKGKIANDKAMADADKARIDAAKAKIGLAGSAAKYVMDNPTPENALAAIQHLADNGIWKPEQAAQYAQQVQANPGGIKQMAELLFRGALDADKQLMSRYQTDAGGTITNSTFDPVTGQTGLIGTTQKTATPGEVMTDTRTREEGAANRSVTIRGQNLTRQNALDRLEYDNRLLVSDSGGPGQVALTRQYGKAPPGFRWKSDGGLESIPGGPADIKAGAEGEKRKMRQEALTAQAGSVLDEISQAKALVGLTTAGVGGLAAGVPMTDARKLAGHIETIKANLGFDRLQQMRDMSPTGGALGQVAVQELNSLQASVAKLDQLQKPSELSAALQKIEGHYKRWQDTLGGSTGGATGGFDAPKAGAPKVGAVEGGYRFKGGDPSKPENWEKQ